MSTTTTTAKRITPMIFVPSINDYVEIVGGTVQNGKLLILCDCKGKDVILSPIELQDYFNSLHAPF